MSWRFVTCAALFVTCLLTANTIAAKLIVVGGVVLTAGIVIFPISYVLGDVLTEVWGYGAARRVIWLGFACNALMVAAIWLGGQLPPAPFWKGDAAYPEILGKTARIVIVTSAAAVLEARCRVRRDPRSDATHRRRLVRRLPRRRIRQLIRAGQAQDRDAWPLALDAHHRLDGRGAGARQRSVRQSRVCGDRAGRRARAPHRGPVALQGPL